MPVDLPPVKKSAQTIAVMPSSLLDRSLNWLAFAVGVGLCAWALKHGTHLII
jgi:hypothetical protein